MFPTTRYAVNDKAAFITAFVLPATDLLGPALAHWKNGRVAAAARPHSSVLFFLISQIGVNIAANSVSAANDLNCLFPRIVQSPPAFISFMAGYAIQFLLDNSTATHDLEAEARIQRNGINRDWTEHTGQRRLGIRVA
ncbi:hypothetical protein V1519DRAFT_473529 [Lipomyces tetrasporus]